MSLKVKNLTLLLNFIDEVKLIGNVRDVERVFI